MGTHSPTDTLAYSPRPYHKTTIGDVVATSMPICSQIIGAFDPAKLLRNKHFRTPVVQYRSASERDISCGKA